MRFILTANGFAPTDGAIMPELIQRGVEASAESITLNVVEKVMMWAAHIGLPLLTEGLLVFSLFCFLMAITGHGKWMERGVKSLIGFAMVGVAAHAV